MELCVLRHTALAPQSDHAGGGGADEEVSIAADARRFIWELSFSETFP